ncbi:MAG: sulfotransferase [Rudaea sp.]
MTASSRLDGLAAQTIEALRQSSQALQGRDVAQAIRAARQAAQAAPEHPEVLRRLALALVAQGPSEEAVAAIARAVAQRPDDGVLANAQAIVLQRSGLQDAALDALGRAYALQPHSAEIAYNYGRVLGLRFDSEKALKVLEHAVALAPEQRDARATLAMVLGQLGRSAESIAQYRYLLQRDPRDIGVWSALGALRGVRFSADDLAAIERLATQAGLQFESRVRIGFTLAEAYDDNARYAEAYSEYCQANALVRTRIPWNANAHSAEVDGILGAFERPWLDTDAKRGDGIVFIVSLPRAGSTLIEQILASHPQVSAGDERLDLLEIIAAEGGRRGTHLAKWAPLASAEDWQRLGRRYLERMQSVRGAARVFTDKLPGNWLWLGAAMAMLPGAVVVDCRRDPLETAWSCFRQTFAGGTQDFSYDIESIGAFCKDHDRAMRHWRALYPQRMRTQVYESLLADAQTQTRELLAFCGLQFDPLCLRFYENRRTVRTISAVQVREPLRADTAHGKKYGTLLDPLRATLGLPPFAETDATSIAE